MKKSVFLSFFLFFTFVSANAQDIILKTDMSIIMAIVQEINETEVIYKDFSNQKGPVFRVSKNNVHKIKFANGSEQVFNAASRVAGTAPVPQRNYAPAAAAAPYSSYANPYGTNYPAYNRADLYNKTDEQLQYILREDAYNTYVSANRQILGGGITWVTGCGFVIPGLICWAVGAGSNAGLAAVGSVLFSLGDLLLAIGIPIHCIGNARLKWVYEDYEKNGGRAVSLSFGETSNGYGLKISF